MIPKRFPITRQPQGYALALPGHPVTLHKRKRDALGAAIRLNQGTTERALA